jgi:hypothetical protein
MIKKQAYFLLIFLLWNSSVMRGSEAEKFDLENIANGLQRVEKLLQKIEFHIGNSAKTKGINLKTENCTVNTNTHLVTYLSKKRTTLVFEGCCSCIDATLSNDVKEIHVKFVKCPHTNDSCAPCNNRAIIRLPWGSSVKYITAEATEGGSKNRVDVYTWWHNIGMKATRGVTIASYINPLWNTLRGVGIAAIIVSSVYCLLKNV